MKVTPISATVATPPLASNAADEPAPRLPSAIRNSIDEAEFEAHNIATAAEMIEDTLQATRDHFGRCRQGWYLANRIGCHASHILELAEEMSDPASTASVRSSRANTIVRLTESISNACMLLSGLFPEKADGDHAFAPLARYLVSQIGHHSDCVSDAVDGLLDAGSTEGSVH